MDTTKTSIRFTAEVLHDKRIAKNYKIFWLIIGLVIIKFVVSLLIGRRNERRSKSKSLA